MKVYQRIPLIALLVMSAVTFGQKPTLTISAVQSWPGVANGKLSNDGKYVGYTIYNQPAGIRRLIIQSTNSSWKKEFSGSTNLIFTADSKRAIFALGKDSLGILVLPTGVLNVIPGVSESKLPDNEKTTWFVYRSKSAPKDFILRDLGSGVTKNFSDVTSYLFSPQGQTLIMQTRQPKDSNFSNNIEWLNLSNGRMSTIWASGLNEVSGNYAFSPDGNALIFIKQKVSDKGTADYELMYYKNGDSTAKVLVNNKTPGISGRMQLINALPKFSNNSEFIYFTTEKANNRNVPSYKNEVDMDVWNYLDKKLQVVQKKNAQVSPGYRMIISIARGIPIQLAGDNEIITDQNKDYVLVRRDLGNDGQSEASWNLAARASYYLISLIDGSRKVLKEGITNGQERLNFSPDGKWIVYYDFDRKNYFTYEIATGLTRNISKGIATSLEDEENDKPERQLRGNDIIWLADSKSVIIKDTYDLWRLDPRDIQSAKNVTNGYGRKNHIQFDCISVGQEMKDMISDKSVLVLMGFNLITKENGFYTKSLLKTGDPTLVSKGPYMYGDGDSPGYFLLNYPAPLKAKQDDLYLFKRSSATEAPNYFITRDFKTFHQLSDVQPQLSYNWYTSDLHSWKSQNGTELQGVLYKPENFDPSKKYPVILLYYERKSEELNVFHYPKASEDEINIPLFVSNGYLIFTPDIHYDLGAPGQSALNSITSAANYLSRLPFVNAQKMGLQGHSFGGYETNYVIAHSNFFAAACSAAGICDLTSLYGSTTRGGYFKYWAEWGQGRIGKAPWDDPDLYVNNSPVFNANKVTTPLLIMHNKNDMNVEFNQGLEWFTALRRLGKRVWMLQYTDGAHSVDRGAPAIDFHTRMMQFYDHYLKGAPAPMWMTRGIPASLKGITNGLTLEPGGVEPGPGLNEAK